MESRIAIAMGGRIAEEIFFNQLSTGAANDIQQATEMARSMVTEYGMSDKLGPLNFGGGGNHEVFLGRDFAQHREISEDTARLIDVEVQEFVLRNYARAKTAIETHRDQLVAIAEALLVRETLDGNDIEILMKGGTLPPPKAGSTPTAPATVEGAAADAGLNPALKPA
jgi:cell division protease FtsH